MPEKISFIKMLKLIVASEFNKFRHFGFTTVVIVPAFVLILMPFILAFGTLDISPLGILIAAGILVVLVNYLLKKYSRKWYQQYAETIKRNKKRILQRFVIYAVTYWGIAIAAVSLTSFLT